MHSQPTFAHLQNPEPTHKFWKIVLPCNRQIWLRKRHCETLSFWINKTRKICQKGYIGWLIKVNQLTSELFSCAIIFYRFLNIFVKKWWKQIFVIFFFKVDNTVYNTVQHTMYCITVWKGLDSDPDPNKGWDPELDLNWGKFQDPDPNKMYLIPQHWYIQYSELYPYSHISNVVGFMRVKFWIGKDDSPFMRVKFWIGKDDSVITRTQLGLD